MSVRQCPKCNGRMVRGFVPDFSHGAILVGKWQKGSPKKSFWTSTKNPGASGIPIGTFRCEGCGYLEHYADSTFAAK